MSSQARSIEEGAVGTARAARSRLSWATRAGYAAFAWSLLFAAAHVYWAFGGTALLGQISDPSTGVLFNRDPWSYVSGWAILSLLFVFAGPFPLALVWTGGRRTSRRAMQLGTTTLGYAGMVLLALFGLTTQNIGLVVFGCAMCVLGLIFAIVRPRGRPIAGWTVLVATWALGLAMSVYGCGYVVAAVGAIDSELFLVYLITGGVIWLGGALFAATAWLATRGKAIRATPAPLVAESVRLRSPKSGSPQENTDTAENRSAFLRTERRTS